MGCGNKQIVGHGPVVRDQKGKVLRHFHCSHESGFGPLQHFHHLAFQPARFPARIHIHLHGISLQGMVQITLGNVNFLSELIGMDEGGTVGIHFHFSHQMTSPRAEFVFSGVYLLDKSRFGQLGHRGAYQLLLLLLTQVEQLRHLLVIIGFVGTVAEYSQYLVGQCILINADFFCFFMAICPGINGFCVFLY